MEDENCSPPTKRKKSSVSTEIPSQNITGMTGGQADRVFAIGNVHGDVNVSAGDTLQKLKVYTEEKIKMRAQGMVGVSAVDQVLKKLQRGQNWITITGNAGDGKTTLGYIVLQSLKKKNIYIVDTLQEFNDISKSQEECLIMLNDIFGAFSLDLSALSAWMPHIITILEDHEESRRKRNVIRVLFISRRNVLYRAKDHLERYGDRILDHNNVVDLSEISCENDRLKLLNCHLKSVDLNMQKIARINTPHGFPHCCKMYAELKSKGESIDIEEFFKTPLKFLDNTTKVLVTKRDCKELFVNMIKSEGKLDAYSISDDDMRGAIIEAASELKGSYVTVSGYIEFTHPSVYESVVVVIGGKDPLLIFKYADLSVILQKVNIKDAEGAVDGYVNVEPMPRLLDVLCQRLQQKIKKRDFSVFEHRFSGNLDFCRRLIGLCVHNDSHQPGQTAGTLSINDGDRWGYTMLYTAVMGGRYPAVRVLMEYGADVNITDRRFGRTALSYLCWSGKAVASALQLLITPNTDVNITDMYGRTALHYLCQDSKTDVSAIQLLITPNTDINIADKDGKTALHYMCQSGSVEKSILQLLITPNADTNRRDRYGKTALHYLCKRRQVDVSNMKLLITPSTDVNIVDGGGETALHSLCQSGKADISTIQLLITPNTDVNRKEWMDGMTALHHLCESGKTDVSTMQLLINSTTDFNNTDNFGRTALHYLCRSGKANVNTSELLITPDTNVNITDSQGKTALHYLCQSETVNVSTIQVLVTPNTDVNITDRQGRTALHYLCYNGKYEPSICAVLTKHGADINCTDIFGRTAIDYILQWE